MRLLQRYILFDLLKVFGLLLSGLTVLLVFVGVFREVSENGLGPLHVLQILPFVVPSLLPFTIPATLLLAVCVVYGRLGGDQEITAAKAAGINVLSLLAPAFLLGAVLSVGSFFLTDMTIPWAMANIQRKVTLFMEDIFLDVLRTHHHVSNHDRGFQITVMDVQGKTLIKPVFQYKPRGHKEGVTFQAEQARLQFDMEEKQVILHLVDAHGEMPGQQSVSFPHHQIPFPLPREISGPKPRHMSVADIRNRLDEKEHKLQQAQDFLDMEAAMALTLGNFDQLTGPELATHQTTLKFDSGALAKLNTEVHSRLALSTSCLFFVLLGGPFAISQAKRQFLTSFFVCFVPILLIYYPISLLMMNLSKTGTINPAWSMWTGNLILLVSAAFVLRKVMKH